MKRAGDLIRMRAFARRPDAGKLTIFLVDDEFNGRRTRWGAGDGGVQWRAYNRGLKKFNKTRGEKCIS